MGERDFSAGRPPLLLALPRLRKVCRRLTLFQSVSETIRSSGNQASCVELIVQDTGPSFSVSEDRRASPSLPARVFHPLGVELFGVNPSEAVGELGAADSASRGLSFERALSVIPNESA